MRPSGFKHPSFGTQSGFHFKIPLLMGVRSVNHRPSAPFDIVDQDIQTAEMLDHLVYKSRYLVGV